MLISNSFFPFSFSICWRAAAFTPQHCTCVLLSKYWTWLLNVWDPSNVHMGSISANVVRKETEKKENQAQPQKSVVSGLILEFTGYKNNLVHQKMETACHTFLLQWNHRNHSRTVSIPLNHTRPWLDERRAQTSPWLETGSGTLFWGRDETDPYQDRLHQSRAVGTRQWGCRGEGSAAVTPPTSTRRALVVYIRGRSRAHWLSVRAATFVYFLYLSEWEGGVRKQSERASCDNTPGRNKRQS